MPGIRIEPSAATSATAEPEISAKNIDAPIDTCASPPRIQPNSARRERDQALRDARRVHDRAGQDEQRDREQREARRAVVGDDGEVGQRCRRRGVDDHRDQRDDAERHRDRHVEQHQREHGREEAEHHGHRDRLSAARRRRAPAPGRGRPDRPRATSSIRYVSSATMISAARDRDHRLHDAHRHPRQAHQRVGREHRQDRRADPAEQHEERDHERAARRCRRRAAPRHGIIATSSGQPMCARLTDASADAVEREPREQDRRDLVVPDERTRRACGTRRPPSPRRRARPSARRRPISSTRP